MFYTCLKVIVVLGDCYIFGNGYERNSIILAEVHCMQSNVWLLKKIDSDFFFVFVLREVGENGYF